MNIQILSDLHLEFHQDQGRSFIDSLNPEGVDLLIIAGDLSVGGRLVKVIELLCDKYPVDILYVPGNHEYYTTSFEVVDAILESCSTDKFKVLNPGLVVCGGQRFLGTTMWFPFDYRAVGYEHNLNDFNQIKDFRKHVYRKNSKGLEFLRNNMRPGDVVITHHAPSYQSVGDEYKASTLNPFFVCDVEKMIMKQKPKIWIHGHMHDSKDYMIDETRVICNPFGYVKMDENQGFNDQLIVTI